MLGDADSSCNMCGAEFGGAAGARPASVPVPAAAPVPVAQTATPPPPAAESVAVSPWSRVPAPVAPASPYDTGPSRAIGGTGSMSNILGPVAGGAPFRVPSAPPPMVHPGQLVTGAQPIVAPPIAAPEPPPQARPPQAPVRTGQPPPPPPRASGPPGPPPRAAATPPGASPAPPPLVRSWSGNSQPPPPVAGATPLSTPVGSPMPPEVGRTPVPTGTPVLVGFLVCFQHEPAGKFWPVSSGVTPAGRGSLLDGSGVRFPDPSASQGHAVLRGDAETGYLFVEDLGSRNGTFVNDERIAPNAPRRIVDDDRLRFAGTTFVVKTLVTS